MPERTVPRYHEPELAMGCPDDARIVAFAHGGLDVEERRALREHLDECPECAGLVAEAVRCFDPVVTTDALPLSLVVSPANVADPPLGHGSAVGRYLLLHLLGAGGLGQVWAAYDPELDRRVAVKLIRPQARARLAADELRARLVREAQSIARVRDPNVVAVHDAGRFGEQVFIAMELVEGPTLGQWLRERARKWDVIRDAFVQAGRGLAAVHAAGLVHRDFKPGNVLVDDDDRMRVADFGLARAEQITPIEGAAMSSASPPSDGESSGITASGLVVGTPAYMAPEQHASAPVDARADQFAFCVAFYEALYGHRPFAGATPAALRDAILGGRIDKPATPHAAPSWLLRAIVRGLAREPGDRYESMNALLDAIMRDKALRRRGGLGIALAVGLGGLALGLGFRGTPPSAEATATSRVDELVDATHRAAARAHFVYPPPDDPHARTAYVEVVALESLEGDEAESGDRAAVALRGELAGTLVRLGDEYWERDGGRIFALDYYAAALVFDPSHERALERAVLTATQRATLVAQAASLSFTEAELAAAAPLRALALDDEAERAAALSEVRSSAQLSATTEAALDRLLPASAPRRGAVDDTATIAANEASDEETVAASTTPARRGRGGGKAPTLRAAAAEPAPAPPIEDDAGPRDPAAAAKEAARGLAALRRGDLDGAEVAFHSALRADRRNADALAGLGEVAFQRRAYKAAARYLERAVAVAPARANLHLELGDVYFKVLRYEDALRQYEEAQKRGSAPAGARLDRLRQKLGDKGGSR
jgi:tetratricopeptide (TPR) repeat protein